MTRGATGSDDAHEARNNCDIQWQKREHKHNADDIPHDAVNFVLIIGELVQK